MFLDSSVRSTRYARPRLRPAQPAEAGHGDGGVGGGRALEDVAPVHVHMAQVRRVLRVRAVVGVDDRQRPAGRAAQALRRPDPVHRHRQRLPVAGQPREDARHVRVGRVEVRALRRLRVRRPEFRPYGNEGARAARPDPRYRVQRRTGGEAHLFRAGVVVAAGLQGAPEVEVLAGGAAPEEARVRHLRARREHRPPGAGAEGRVGAGGVQAAGADSVVGAGAFGGGDVGAVLGLVGGVGGAAEDRVAQGAEVAVEGLVVPLGEGLDDLGTGTRDRSRGGGQGRGGEEHGQGAPGTVQSHTAKASYGELRCGVRRAAPAPVTPHGGPRTPRLPASAAAPPCPQGVYGGRSPRRSARTG
ncbi:hypothetical protein SSPIM334S_02442 [Streptomyces spiroverticillatus]